MNRSLATRSSSVGVIAENAATAQEGVNTPVNIGQHTILPVKEQMVAIRGAETERAYPTSFRKAALLAIF